MSLAGDISWSLTGDKDIPMLRTALMLAGAIAAQLMFTAPMFTAPVSARPLPVAMFAQRSLRLTLIGPATPEATIACFTATAAHPGFAHLARTVDGALYQLRFDGLMFETIAFAPRAGGGTLAEIRLADASTGGHAQFEARRGRALRACLAGPQRLVERAR
jgi:hypothetical protein